VKQAASVALAVVATAIFGCSTPNTSAANGTRSGGACASEPPVFAAEQPLAIDPGCLSPSFTVPWLAGQGGVAFRVSGDAGECFQVDSMTDDRGHAYVVPSDYGPFCLTCEQRTSVAVGGGLFVYPSRGGPFAPSGSLHVQLGLRDCATFTSSACDTGPAPPLSARTLALPPPRTSGIIALRALLCPASVFYRLEGGDAELANLLDQVNALLAPAGVVASYSSVNRLPAGAVCDATFSPSDPSALTALLQQGRGLDEDAATLSVVFAGCLLAEQPVLGSRTEPDGYTPRIPGGNGDADAVFVRGSLCDTAGRVSIAWSATALGRVLAHEVGHYLGLYHTVEADGTLDQLDDTSAAADNLMYFQPSIASATGLSATQGEIARRHPLVHGCPPQ